MGCTHIMMHAVHPKGCWSHHIVSFIAAVQLHPCSRAVHGQSAMMLTVYIGAWQGELQSIERYMKYCLELRERRPAAQRAVFQTLGITHEDILLQEPRAGVLKPSYVLVRDRQQKAIALAIRGTHSMKVHHTHSGVDLRNAGGKALRLMLHFRYQSVRFPCQPMHIL